MPERGQWSNKAEFVLAVAGNIVGLGNIWRFPYLCFKNGGGAFLVPYFLFAVICGIPLFVLDSSIGQYTKQGVATSWGKLCPLAEGIGYSSVVIVLFNCLCYNILLAWSLFYLIASLSPQLPWISCNNDWNTGNCVELSDPLNRTIHSNYSVSSTTEYWESRVLNVSSGIESLGSINWKILLCLLASWVMCYFCVWKGVKSTGKAVYFTATFPYVMLIVLLIRGITLPGALQGIKSYLYLQPSRLLDSQVWVDAATQIFFSYSLGAGSLIVLGSYNHYRNNCYRDSIYLCILNSCTSFVAGFLVYSVLGFMAEQLGTDVKDVAQPGPGLAFVVYPQAVAMMPLSQLWAACFFIMLILLGLDTQFVGIEVIASAAGDIFPKMMQKPYRKEFFLLIFCTGCFCFQILMTTQGGVYIFQIMDYYACSSTGLIFIGLMESLVIGWLFGVNSMADVIEDMCKRKPSFIFRICWRYCTPLMCIVAFILNLVKYQPLMYNNVYIYPDWAYSIGWLLTLCPTLIIVLWGLVKLFAQAGTPKERLKSLCSPDEKLPLTQKQKAQPQTSETPLTETS